MSSRQNLWYRLGYALERARHAPTASAEKLSGLRERIRASHTPKRSKGSPAARRREEGVGDELMASAAVALAARLLGAWRPREGRGLGSALKGAAAGGAAALLLELVRPLLEGRPGLGELDNQTPDVLLHGAVQGVVYGTVVERWIPGPPLLKGLLYGSAEYAVDPLGGLPGLLGPRTPLSKVPVLMHLLEDVTGEDRGILEHLTFGVALALLYRSSPSSNGMRIERGA
ncbi:MAG: hypothetical protein ACE5GJ_12780 [Gemmatimonadota bacterium]